MAEIEPEALSDLIHYDAETGRLTWMSRSASSFARPSDAKRWEANFSGRPALTALNDQGYLTGIIKGRPYRAHRVAWALAHGRWPDGQIDHLNGDRADNRLVNLRDVTGSHNQRNAKLQRNSQSGVCGVYWHAARGKWRAEITFDGKTRHLGQFSTKADAERARLEANERHGFTERHGQAA